MDILFIKTSLVLLLINYIYYIIFLLIIYKIVYFNKL